MYLRHHYRHFITEVLAIERAARQGGGTPEAATIHALLLRLLEQAKAEAAKDGHGPDRIAAATVAVIGWADARLLACDIRMARGVTLEYSERGLHEAGDDFFHQIKKLGDDDDLRDLHYLLLALGYIGFYERPRSNLEELKDIRRNQRAALKTPPLDPRLLAAEPRRTPQPYEQPAPVAAPIPVRRPWLALVAALALLAPLPALWVPGSSALPGLTLREDPRARVALLMQNVPCAALDTDWSEGDRPGLTLRGYLGSAEDRDRLMQAIALVQGVGTVRDAVDIHPRPFCNFLELLAPYEKASARLPMRLTLANGASKLFLGQKVAFQIALPPVSGYLTLVYVNGRGDVLNLYPNNAREISQQPASGAPTMESLLPPHKELTLYAPAGTEMSFLIHTPKPLFSSPRPLREPPEALLLALRQALEAQRAEGALPVVTHLFFTSEAPSDGSHPAPRGTP